MLCILKTSFQISFRKALHFAAAAASTEPKATNHLRFLSSAIKILKTETVNGVTFPANVAKEEKKLYEKPAKIEVAVSKKPAAAKKEEKKKAVVSVKLAKVPAASKKSPAAVVSTKQAPPVKTKRKKSVKKKEAASTKEASVKATKRKNAKPKVETTAQKETKKKDKLSAVLAENSYLKLMLANYHFEKLHSTFTPSKTDARTLEVYCDGSCLNNGKVTMKQLAGIGVHVVGMNGKYDLGQSIVNEDGPLTNNYAEILAATYSLKQALKVIQDHPCTYRRVVVHSDSAYVVNAITEWIHRWAENDWKLKKGKPVENLKSFQELLKLSKQFKDVQLEWKHVKGHSGIPENDITHKLALEAARGNIL